MRIGIAAGTSMTAATLQRTVGLQRDHRVVWVATGGDAAMQRCAADPPDLVLMDLSVAVAEDGRATRSITTDSRCAVLVVADNVSARAGEVLDAMGHGALDAADMPSCDSPHPAPSALAEKIDTLARLIGPEPGRRSPIVPRAVRPRLIVAIGASAGGPAAVATMLTGIPRGFPGAIVVVQHVHREFVAGMAGWLTDRSSHTVEIARDGDQLLAGRVLLAGADGHLTLQAGGRLAYRDDPRQTTYQPSVDVFFQSVGQHWDGDAIGVLLTGMGRDGAAGLKALRNRRHHTIAQDEATSAVYGMPKAAAALEAAVDILPLDRIAARVLEIAARCTSPATR